MRNKFILSIGLLFLLAQASAQVGIGTITPDASSSLEILSTTKGFLMPRMTAAQRGEIGSPANGLLVFQTDAPAGFWYFVGGVWVRLANTADVSTASLASGFAANTSGTTVAILLGGTDVPLPNSQLFSTGSGITLNGSNTIFTVANAGRYRVAYHVSTTAALLMSVRVNLNGATVPSSVSAPVLSTSDFAKESIIDIPAGGTISLQFFGLLGAAVLSGSATSLSIIRLN